MTSPIAIHMYSQMQHKEYEAQAARHSSTGNAQPEETVENPGLIMGKIAELLQEIREQIGGKSVGEMVVGNQ